MLLLAAFSAATVLSSIHALPTVVIQKNATLVGRDITGFGQEFFGGIPFASPPLGELRFSPPVLQSAPDVPTFDASNYGPSCLQIYYPDIPQSEDCLTVNVLRPAGISADVSLPVMVWIYGGGFFSGASSIYNGSMLVAQSVARGTPIIYASLNYRIGPLGFPGGHESEESGALNLGLKDQLAALQWIQLNIGTFGGDKTKVTVFGESAGSISIAVHFLNLGFDQYARAAIFESGSAATVGVFPAATGQFDWENFVSGVPSCRSLANSGNTFSCLRTVSTDELAHGFEFAHSIAGRQIPWGPTLDGPNGIVPDHPYSLLSQSLYAHLPFIAGTTLDEGTLFTPLTINSTEIIHQWLIANYTPPGVSSSLSHSGTVSLDGHLAQSPLGMAGDLNDLQHVIDLNSAIERVLELYPDDPSLGSPFHTGSEKFGLDSQYKRLAAIQGDLGFDSQRRFWTQKASNDSVKAYGYLFTDPQPSYPDHLGVLHSSEIIYVFGAAATSESAKALSTNIVDYWISFATSLDPNDGLGSPRPYWAQYVPENQVVLQLDGANTTLIPDDYRGEQINFINSKPSIFYNRCQA